MVGSESRNAPAIRTWNPPRTWPGLPLSSALALTVVVHMEQKMMVVELGL